MKVLETKKNSNFIALTLIENKKKFTKLFKERTMEFQVYEDKTLKRKLRRGVHNKGFSNHFSSTIIEHLSHISSHLFKFLYIKR